MFLAFKIWNSTETTKESFGRGLDEPVVEFNHIAGYPAHLVGVGVVVLGTGALGGEAAGLYAETGKIQWQNRTKLRYNWIKFVVFIWCSLNTKV